eukprot:CAMPEP_0202460944 /NCGR_PEP_ID=MMETSP1360-20130828/46714_1 /ASSEMBLY_ACC=CAM_ASM_000848 /TAXON_ID=515479 /ORGANISM="Licmophora paradoxa, Strain CCMP2313" /LENGTH=246 /DNA_ID=CAMNT_0049082807 /DNA_START=21 /DNA_END=761 /DNA_ORIENTATION=-
MSNSEKADNDTNIILSEREVLPQSPITHYTNTSRRVHFSEDSPYVIEYLPQLIELTRSEKCAIWWNRAEYDHIGDTARSICKEIRRHCATMTIGLEEAYRQSRNASNEIEEYRMEEVIEQLSLNSGLAHWCTHGHSRRGLERWSSNSLGDSRISDAGRVKKQIVNGQNNFTAEELRQHYLRLSRCARIFARLMGRADAIAMAAATSSRRWSDFGGAAALQRRRSSYQRTSSLPRQLPLPGLVRATH